MKHGRLYNVDRADVRRVAAALRVDAASRRSASRARRWSSRRCCWSARSTCSRIVPDGFIPSVDTGQLNGQIEAIQGIGFEAMVAHQKEVMDILSKDPNVAAVHLERRRPGWRPAERRPQAARPAHADGRRDHRGAAAEAGARYPACASSCRTRRPSASAACSRGRSTSSRCRTPTPRSSIASRPASRRRCAASRG